MKKKDLTREQVSSVSCPTCGVPAGRRCERFSGARRREPHVDRKFSAMEALVGAGSVHAGPSAARKSKRSWLLAAIPKNHSPFMRKAQPWMGSSCLPRCKTCPPKDWF